MCQVLCFTVLLIACCCCCCCCMHVCCTACIVFAWPGVVNLAVVDWLVDTAQCSCHAPDASNYEHERVKSGKCLIKTECL
jgi:hypothetical protein